MKWIFIILLALPLLSAVSGVSALSSALSSLCSGLTSMLPIAAMLMTVLAGVIYASGQMMGAETRARANTWATAALTGAMMAILISVVSPSVMTAVYGGDITCSGGGSSSNPVIGNGDVCQATSCTCTDSSCTATTCSAGDTCTVCTAEGDPMTCLPAV